ncbi:23 kDa integral membrane protein [Biomphalaria pfeifferi]|uniref:23 kDa integral membrane protein n=1 Tax=Biomphalaria pfeifferi TaxID=112525 RepID=A0AAD8BPS2_BIOPF|nr:23 kDa integral membrane protein [Biomphalaria pfeifferi]
MAGIGAAVVGALLKFIPKSLLEFIFKYVNSLPGVTQSGYEIPKTADDFINLPMISEVGLAFLVLGALLFLIGFLGFCGSCSACCKMLLILFAVIMVGLMAGELVVGTMFLVEDSPIHDTIKYELMKKIKSDYSLNGTDSFSRSFNVIQFYFECCGVERPSDIGLRLTGFCLTNVTLGCYTKLNNVIHDNIVYEGLGFAGLLLLQLIEIIFAIVLFKKNKVSPL